MIIATGSLKSKVLQGGLRRLLCFNSLRPLTFGNWRKRTKGKEGKREACAFVGCLLGGRLRLYITRRWEYRSREGEQEMPEGAVRYMVFLAHHKEAPLQGTLPVLTTQYAL